jgi:hypothetical protein
MARRFRTQNPVRVSDAVPPLRSIDDLSITRGDIQKRSVAVSGRHIVTFASAWCCSWASSPECDLLLQFAKWSRDLRVDRHTAIVEAGRIRLRPITMRSMALIAVIPR